MCFAPEPGFAQLFGDEEKKWERVLMEMKKINSRLVSLKTKDVENLQATQGKLQATQGEVLSQIQALQTMLPNIQGVVEQSNSELGKQVTDVTSKLADMEIFLKDELDRQNNNQAETIDNLRVELSSKSDVLRSELTSQVGALRSEVGSQVDAMGNTMGTRIDSMGKETGAYIDSMRNQMSLQVDAMGKETGSHIDTMKNEMGGQVSSMRTETAARLVELKTAMALDVEKINQILARDMEKINQNIVAGLGSGDQDKKIDEVISLLAELSKLDEQKAQQISLRQEAVIAKFAEMDVGTKTMIGILSKGLEENQNVGVGVKNLNAGLTALNENITINRSAIAKFKSIFDTNLTNLVKSQGDIQTQNANVIKNATLLNQNLQVAETKINKLAETIKTLYAQSAANAKTVATMQDQVSQITGIVGNTDEKFDTLIATTKLVLAHSKMMEEKLDGVVAKVEGNQANDSGLTEEKFVKLIEILKKIATKQDNVMKGVASHEVNMTQVLNVHEGNVKQALNVYDDNIAGALKVYSQSLTEYEGNLIQAWNVHDKNTTLGQADQALLVESFKTAQEEIQRILTDLNKNTAEVNSSSDAIIRKTAVIEQKTAEIGKISSELNKKMSATGAGQQEIKNTINDLRKKANVNISRNDDILKSLKKLQFQ